MAACKAGADYSDESDDDGAAVGAKAPARVSKASKPAPAPRAEPSDVKPEYPIVVATAAEIPTDGNPRETKRLRSQGVQLRA